MLNGTGVANQGPVFHAGLVLRAAESGAKRAHPLNPSCCLLLSFQACIEPR